MMMSIMIIGGCGAKKEESNPVEGEVQQEEDTTEPTEEEEVKEEESEEPATPAADLGDTWVNLDNRSFAVNGTVYLWGKYSSRYDQW